MILSKLNIVNFRGLKNYQVDLNERLNVFSGENGVGKTTIIDAIMWMLTGETLVYGKQDSDNRNSNSLKDVINVLLETNDGLVFERKYYDVWLEDEDGNLRYARTENQFKINNAKYKKEEYFDFIRTNLGLENNIKTKEFNLLRGIVDYNYFSSIDYKDARKFTEELLKLKSDNELLSDEKFSSIKTNMQLFKYDIAKCLNKYQNDLKETNKALETNNTLVEDLKNKFDKKAFDNYNSLISKRNEILTSNWQNNPKYLALNQSLEKIGTTIQDEEKAIVEQIMGLENKINELIGKGNKCNANLVNFQNEINHFKNQISGLEQNKQSIENAIESEKAKTFKAIICPHCNKVVNESEEKDFENVKKANINSYKKKIESINEEIKVNENAIKEIESKITNENQVKANLGKEYVDNRTQLEKAKQEKTNNTKVNELLLEKEKTQKEIELFINDFNTNKNNKLIDITNELDKLSSIVSMKNTIEQKENEIKELKVKKAKQENDVELVKDYKELKLKMIKDNTNNVFPKLDFEIIEVNENTGSIKECCYTKLKGVEYKGVNDGHRKYVGVMLIEDIKRALGLQDLPIIFDKRADIDNKMLGEIMNLTKAQIFTTQVTNEKNITLKGIEE